MKRGFRRAAFFLSLFILGIEIQSNLKYNRGSIFADKLEEMDEIIKIKESSERHQKSLS